MRALGQTAIIVLLFILVTASRLEAGSMTLAWDRPTDAGVTVGYVVRFGTAAGEYSTTIDVGMVFTYRIEGLADGTTYYFAVQAYNSRRERSELSAEVSATTSGTRRGGSSIPSPGGNVTNVVAFMRDGRFVDISWLPVTGAQAYRVEVGSAPGHTAYSAITGNTSIDFDSSNLPIATYHVRVRGVFGGVPGPASNEDVVPGNDVARLDTMTGDCGDGPGAPRQFAAGAHGTAVQLSWQPGGGSDASSYLLQVGSAPGLQNLMLATFPGNQRALAATAPHGIYALRLVSVNECGASTWGAETLLSVGVPTLGANGAPGSPASLTHEVSGTTVTLRWTAPLTGGPATRYLIEAATAAGPFAYDTATPGTSFTNVNTPPGTYVVTVRAGNASGFGPPSAPVTVIIP